jgi:hypothetical protein
LRVFQSLKDLSLLAVDEYADSLGGRCAQPTTVASTLALIVLVCLTPIQAVGTNANNKFNTVKNALT